LEGCLNEEKKLRVKGSRKLLDPLHDLVHQPLLASRQHLAKLQKGATGFCSLVKLATDRNKSRRL
jgi:hypothetical protein